METQSPRAENGGASVSIMPLGAGQEVGRSCIIVKYLDKTIMMDCGIHPGYQGHASLPFLDQVDLAGVDVMLITHFHLDHVAAVPFVVGHTNFKGRIFMTHPTKAIAHTLLKDFVKLNKSIYNLTDNECERLRDDFKAEYFRCFFAFDKTYESSAPNNSIEAILAYLTFYTSYST